MTKVFQCIEPSVHQSLKCDSRNAGSRQNRNKTFTGAGFWERSPSTASGPTTGLLTSRSCPRLNAAPKKSPAWVISQTQRRRRKSTPQSWTFTAGIILKAELERDDSGHAKQRAGHPSRLLFRLLRG